MPDELPPLGKFVVMSFAGDDTAYPVVATSQDNRAAGYTVPTLGVATCPDDRFLGHIFIGVSPTNVDNRVLWNYEILPGPWILDTRDDLLLGPVQRRRRSILVSTIPATLPVPTATVKTTYEARSGPNGPSAIVAWEIVETFSDGSGTAGNPVFPIIPGRPYDDRIRGAITRTEQIVIKASQVSSISETGGVVTRIEYEPVDEFHYREVIEKWTLANTPTITTQRYDEASDTWVVTQRKLKLTTAIIEAITLVNTTDDTITLIESEGYDNIEAIEVATVWTEPVARSSGTQIKTKSESLPFKFPNLMTDFEDWAVTNGFIGYSPAFVARVEHETRTFWTFSATKPTLTLDGALLLATIDNLVGTGVGISDILIDNESLVIPILGVTVTITINDSTPTATNYISSFLGQTLAVLGSVDMDPNRYRWNTSRKYIFFIEQAHPTYVAV